MCSPDGCTWYCRRCTSALGVYHEEEHCDYPKLKVDCRKREQEKGRVQRDKKKDVRVGYKWKRKCSLECLRGEEMEEGHMKRG